MWSSDDPNFKYTRIKRNPHKTGKNVRPLAVPLQAGFTVYAFHVIYIANKCYYPIYSPNNGKLNGSECFSEANSFSADQEVLSIVQDKKLC
jgi:hypothetical protein